MKNTSNVVFKSIVAGVTILVSGGLSFLLYKNHNKHSEVENGEINEVVFTDVDSEK